MALSTVTRRFCSMASIAVLLLGLLFVAGGPASAGTVEDERRFVTLINEYRATEGLPALELDRELQAASREWSRQMAADNELAHAPDISVGVTSPWVAIGENVGVNPVQDVPMLFEAFKASPLHDANLVDPRFTNVGVGVVYDSTGQLWTTHRFMAVDDTPPTTATPSTPAQTTGDPTPTPTSTATPTATPASPSPPQTVAEPPTTTVPPTSASDETTAVTQPLTPPTAPQETGPDGTDPRQTDPTLSGENLDPRLIATVLHDLASVSESG